MKMLKMDGTMMLYISTILSIIAFLGGLGNARGAGTDPFFSAPDGTPTTTRMGSNAAMKVHRQHFFNMPTSAQDSTLDEVRQRPERTELGDKPDDKEIIRFTRKAKYKKSPGDNNIPAEFWKVLVGSDKDLQSEEGQQSFGVWRSVVYELWEKGSCSSDWLQ